MERNKHGEIYFPGKACSEEKRKKVLDLYYAGKSFRKISEATGITIGGCFKIAKNGSISKGRGKNILFTFFATHIMLHYSCLELGQYVLSSGTT